MVNRQIHLESVYVAGPHQEFVDAVGDKLREISSRYHEVDEFEVEDVSHAFAFAPDGQAHWSAFLRIVVTQTLPD